MNQRTTAVVAAAMYLILAAPAHSQDSVRVALDSGAVLPAPDSPLQATRSRVLRLVATDSLPSLAVAAYVDGRLLWSEVVGFADRQQRLPATFTTRYGLGSLTKSITGTAVMRLVDRGSIDLDAPVNRYLGDVGVRVWAGKESDLTVRRLLTMTGGIPHYVRNYWLDEPLQPPSGDDLIRDYGISTAPPGARYLYSNLAYGIAERLIEKVTGQPYADHLAEDVFVPLGMTDARVRRDPRDPSTAQAYHRGDTALAYWFTDPEGAAAVQASLRDLVRYAHYHLNSPSALSPVASGPSDNHSFEYLFGWGVFNVGEGHRVLVSDGNVFGATSNLQLFPREKAFLVLVTNSSTATPIIESLALELAPLVAPAAARRRDALFASPDWGREEPLPATWTGRWAGVVHTPTGRIPMTMEIDDSSAVRVRIGEGEPVAARDVMRAGDRLEGRVDLRLPTTDTEGYAHGAHFAFALYAGRLVGTVSARTTDDPRAHFVLPFFAELESVLP